jgi:hypothetical protein
MAVSTIDSTGIAAAGVAQTNLATNVVGNGPAFLVYLNATQTITANTWTKVAFDTKSFDTNTNFNNTSTYRFTPTVAGYYQLNGQATLGGASINGYVALYKNGSIVMQGNTTPTASGASGQTLVVSTLQQANGSSDYFEIWVYSGGTSITAGLQYANFSGFLARSA